MAFDSAAAAIDAVGTRQALGRVAADLGLQFDEVGEHVGLTAQFVGDHRRLGRNRRDDGNADAAALHGFDERAEVTVAGSFLVRTTRLGIKFGVCAMLVYISRYGSVARL